MTRFGRHIAPRRVIRAPVLFEPGSVFDVRWHVYNAEQTSNEKFRNHEYVSAAMTGLLARGPVLFEPGVVSVPSHHAGSKVRHVRFACPMQCVGIDKRVNTITATPITTTATNSISVQVM